MQKIYPLKQFKGYTEISDKSPATKFGENRGPYMSAHVSLNLLNELKKRDKMRDLSSMLSLFHSESNKFNNTGA